MRIEKIGEAILYLGDCREILPAFPNRQPILPGKRDRKLAEEAATRYLYAAAYRLQWAKDNPRHIVQPKLANVQRETTPERIKELIGMLK